MASSLKSPFFGIVFPMLAARSSLVLAIVSIVGCSPQPQTESGPDIAPSQPVLTSPLPTPDAPPAKPHPAVGPALPDAPTPPPRAPEPAPTPTPALPAAPEPRPRAFHMPDAWVGRWNGPEGLYLDVAPGEATNTVRLRLKDSLDGENDYTGMLLDDGIRFERAGRTEVIRRGSGAETGFSALRNRVDCVIVRLNEEGYCRPVGRPRMR